MSKAFVSLLSAAVLLTGCEPAPSSSALPTGTPVAATAEVTTAVNPLLTASPLPYAAPQFDQIRDEHFQPAFVEGIRQQLLEIAAIAANPEPPTFANTLIPLEQSGQLLGRVAQVFYNLAGSDSNEARRAIEAEMAPRLAAHSDDIYLNPQLYQRIKAIYEARASLGLTAEALRLVELYQQRFVRAGAELNDQQQVQIRRINEELSSLANSFSQNLLKASSDGALLVADVARLKGMSEADIATAAAEAKARGHEGQYLLSLSNTTRQPLLASIDDRALRQQLWQASRQRASSGENDNRPLVARMAQLRAQKAALLGYANWAAYTLEPQMAQTPQAAMSMLASMVPDVVNNTQQEAEAIKAVMAASGADFELQPWDWEYYAERVRQQQYALDEAQVREYFEFERVLKDGVFFTMNALFGIRFEPRPDLPVYHPDVLAYEVFDQQGNSLALFYADYFAREGKRGGAWMSTFVDQSRLLGHKPVVVNVMNIQKAPPGQPTLLSFDHVTTMFHEMGHGVHGIFSAVEYPSLSGTSVSTDFVEFPSTFQEDWAAHPAVIGHYGRHYQSGAPIPAELLAKIQQSRSFNQGFDTLEYLAAALLDMEWHSLAAEVPLQDVAAFEKQVLAKHQVALNAVPPRYLSPYFAHSMGGGYSANYYAYLWSEILAADAYAFVQQQGGLSRANGERFRQEILAVGNSRPLMDSYVAFRGAEPTTDALLVRRGLKTKPTP